MRPVESSLIVIRRLLMVGLGVVVIRLINLQLVHGALYRQQAEHNRLRVISQPAPRGLILDRAGRRLATNRTAFQIVAIPQELTDRQTLFARLSPLVAVSPEELERRFEDQRTVPFLPVALLKDVAKPVALQLEEERLGFPGIAVESVTTRHYPLKTLAAHLIGYVGQPSPEAFPTLKQYGVRPQEFVGRTGLEQELDAYLRGRAGGSLIEVDHRARQVRVMGHRDPIPGKPVSLTLDANLQAFIEQRFGEQPGACVVLKPQTGELLAMVSVPSFEPEVFARQDTLAIRSLLADSGSPLRNRATLGEYTPGSIMKLVTAATALEQRVITPETAIRCPGFLTIGNRQFHCWNRDGHGVVTLRSALMWSCNVYFMEVGRRLGGERLRRGLTAAGLGRSTGWLLDEQSGTLPMGRHLMEGEVALLAIGQGEILVTPLQAALLASAIANEGWAVEPWVVKSVDGYPAARPHAWSLGWSRDTLAVVRAGMLAVVNEAQGTGVHAHSDTVRIAGKTGTAQTHVPGHPHGWFVGFCPADHPVIAMAIVAEHGGSGGDLPAAIAKAICESVIAPAPIPPEHG